VKRNFYFIGTTAVILLNILSFAFGGNIFSAADATPSTAANFDLIIRSFLNVFCHGSLGSLLFSILCFLICGLYLERKLGSVKFALLVFALSFFGAMTTAANYFSVGWQGFSVAIYALFAYILIDFIFSKDRLFWFLLPFMCVAICFNGGLLFNLGHYSGFLAGIVFGLTMQFFARRKTKILSKNFFYMGTTVAILINVLLYAAGGKVWQNFVEVGAIHPGWNSYLYLNPTVRAFLNAFSHLNWVHVAFNMSGLLVCGMYLERKIGSGNLVLMILSLTFFTAIVSVASMFNAVHWIGFSGVLYLLFAYVIIDFLFSFQKNKRNRNDIIIGAAALLFIYINMSFDARSFVWYPHALIFHEGHLFGFLAGLALGVAVQVINLMESRCSRIIYNHLDPANNLPNN